LNSFKKAFSQLSKFIKKKKLNELEKQGLIQAFEYTYELAWNMLRTYFSRPHGRVPAAGEADARSNDEIVFFIPLGGATPQTPAAGRNPPGRGPCRAMPRCSSS